MGWLSWFRKEPSDDYEQILAALSLSISSRQTRLSELRVRERRATLWATLYTLAAWLVYSFVWWLNLVPAVFRERTRSNVEIERVAQGAPVLVGPIIALFLRRIIQLWYTRKGNAEEATLKKLLTQQRTTIEDIKKKTNYYSTRNLIERYDASPERQPSQVPQTPQRKPNPAANDPNATGLRQRIQKPSNAGPGMGDPTGTPGVGNTPFQPQNFAATPPQPPRRQWFDKVADALLGSDDGSSPSLDPSRSRYALICGRCSAHNGLVLESLWEDTQYVCPKCGFFNPAPRSIKNPNRNRSVSPAGSSIADASFSPETDVHGDGLPIVPRIPRPEFLPVPTAGRRLSVASSGRGTVSEGEEHDEDDTHGGVNDADISRGSGMDVDE